MSSPHYLTPLLDSEVMRHILLAMKPQVKHKRPDRHLKKDSSTGYWHFRMTIPKDIRDRYDGKQHKWKSLRTKDIGEARKLRDVLESETELEFAEVRRHVRSVQHTTRTRMVLNEYMKQALEIAREGDSSDQGDEIRSILADSMLTGLSNEIDRLRGDGRHAEADEAYVKAKSYYDVATRKEAPLDEYLKEYLNGRSMKESYKKEHWRTIELLNKHGLETVSQVDRVAAYGFLTALIAGKIDGKPKRPQTVKGKQKTILQRYWRYLIQRGVIEGMENPWKDHDLPDDQPMYSDDEAEEKIGAADVAKLTKAVDAANFQKSNKADVPDAVRIAQCTGMRLNEICSLKADDIQGDDKSGVKVIRIRAEATKGNTAGRRKVAIVDSLLPIIQRRVDNAKENGWLFPNASSDIDGNRGENIGKAFGRVKKELGYKPRKDVFHSFRHFVYGTMQELDYEPVKIDRLLGHTPEKELAARYGKSQFDLKEQKAFLEKVADLVQKEKEKND